MDVFNAVRMVLVEREVYDVCQQSGKGVELGGKDKNRDQVKGAEAAKWVGNAAEKSGFLLGLHDFLELKNKSSGCLYINTTACHFPLNSIWPSFNSSLRHKVYSYGLIHTNVNLFIDLLIYLLVL